MSALDDISPEFRAMLRREADLDVEFMRRVGLTEWGDKKLGPVPPTEAQTTTQQPESPDDREKRARQDQRMIALAASGRLVPRFGEDRK